MRLKDLLYLNRSDRRALTFVLTLAVIAIATLILFGNGDMYTEGESKDSARTEYSSYGNRGCQRYGSYRATSGKDGYYAVEQRAVSRFPFDPNTADSTALLSLGLQPWQVRSIYRYRAKGGIFRRKEDFGRVYGLTNKQYEELAPYIRIAKPYQPYVSVNEPRPAHVNIPDSIAAKHYPVKLKAGETIELNSADSAQLVRVPGIGPYYARQIENRRKWLGGYYSVDQLLEIEYLPREAVNYFRVNPDGIKKLKVNKLSLSELKRHPYINFYQAKAIVDYRRLRGPLRSIDELKLMKVFTESDIERMKHYIEY